MLETLVVLSLRDLVSPTDKLNNSFAMKQLPVTGGALNLVQLIRVLKIRLKEICVGQINVAGEKNVETFKDIFHKIFHPFDSYLSREEDDFS